MIIDGEARRRLYARCRAVVYGLSRCWRFARCQRPTDQVAFGADDGDLPSAGPYGLLRAAP